MSSLLAPRAFAQGSKRISLYDPIAENDKDDPAKRDQWMMRGRTAPKGQNASALHYRAYQQKMAMRAHRAAMAAKSGTGSVPQAGTPWVALGPAPLTSDQNFFGEVTGRSTAIAIDPSDTTGNTVYIAGASGGVWKSTNAANSVATNVTWTPVTDQQASLVNGALSVKSDGTVVLVGTGEPNNAIDSYYGQGILRSTNGGTSWTLVTSSDSGAHPFAGIGFTKFAWLPSSKTVVAAAADAFKGDQEALLNPNTANLGMYLSTDGGATWKWQQPTDHILADTSATDVTYNAKAGKFFASIQYHGIYSSTNGTNWARLSTQPSSVLTLTNCPTATDFSGGCPLFRGQITTVPGRNEMYFWFVDINDGDQGIWQSTDGGATWKQIDETGIANCEPMNGNNGCGTTQAFYNLEISAVANGTGTDIYAGAVNLFKCNLASGATTCSALDPALGASWLNLTHVYGCSTIANVHPDEHGLDFAVVGGKDIMYFGNDGGVYRALDGYTGLIYGSCSSAGNNSFDNLNTNMGSMTQFVSMSVHPSSQNIVMGGTQDNGSPASASATTSAQFYTVLGGDGGYNVINPNPGNIGNGADGVAGDEWFASNPNSVIGFCESGVSCSDANFFLLAAPGQGIDQGAFYTPFILDPQSTDEILIGTCQVLRGNTAGTTFSSISPDFDTGVSGTCGGGEVNQVDGLAAGGPKDGTGLSNVVYAVTIGYGPLFAPPVQGGNVWVTTNAATTLMSNVTGTINPNGFALSSVAMDNSDATGKTAYVGVMGFTTSHVWKTVNAGGAWTDWTGSGGTALPDSPVNDVFVDSGASQIYAATDVGVFVSSTSSASWTEVGTAAAPGATGYLPNVPATAIRMFNSGGIKKLRVSTYGRGIWEYSLGVSPSFTLSANPTSVSVAQGGTGTSTITVTSLNGFNSATTFTTSALPTGVTAAFNPTSVTPPANGTATTVVTFTASASAAAGTSTVTITGTSGTLTATTTVSLTVTTGPGFTLAANPSSLSITPTLAGGTSTITVTDVGGFSGNVTLAASGLPTGVTAAFNPNPTGTTSVVTLTAGASASAGTATVTITGTSGALTATTTIALTVTAAPSFTLSANPTSVSVAQGATGTSTITETSVLGFSAATTFTASGLPAGVSATFNPMSVTPPANGTATTVATFTVGATATTGTATVTITGTSGALTATTTVTLTVNQSYALSTPTTPAPSPVAAGLPATSTFNVTSSDGKAFASAVTFACNGLPADGTITCGFSSVAQGATSPQTVTLTIQTSGPNTPAARSQRQRADNRSPWLPLTLPLAGIIMVGVAGRKMSKFSAIACLFVSLALLGLLVACGSSSSPPVVVNVSPTGATVFASGLAGSNWPPQTATFTATVTNNSNTAVNWSVSANGGSITSGGVYTAPTVAAGLPASATVTATSQADSTKVGTATITLKPTTVPGQYPLTVTATEGAVQKTSTQFTLTTN